MKRKFSVSGNSLFHSLWQITGHKVFFESCRVYTEKFTMCTLFCCRTRGKKSKFLCIGPSKLWNQLFPPHNVGIKTNFFSICPPESKTEYLLRNCEKIPFQNSVALCKKRRLFPRRRLLCTDATKNIPRLQWSLQWHSHVWNDADKFRVAPTDPKRFAFGPYRRLKRNGSISDCTWL